VMIESTLAPVPNYSILTSASLQRIITEIAVSVSECCARSVKSCRNPLVGVVNITIVVDKLLEVLVVLTGITLSHPVHCVGTESLDGTAVFVANFGIIRVRQTGIATFDCEFTGGVKTCDGSNERIKS
jgi:hypothetical protein